MRSDPVVVVGFLFGSFSFVDRSGYVDNGSCPWPRFSFRRTLREDMRKEWRSLVQWAPSEARLREAPHSLRAVPPRRPDTILERIPDRQAWCRWTVPLSSTRHCNQKGGIR